MLRAVIALFAFFILTTGVLAAQTCVVGSLVVRPGGHVLPVVEVNGASCRIEGMDDGVYYNEWWKATDLEPADQNAIVTDEDRTLYAGTYKCSTNGNYLYIDIIIRADGTYTDQKGTQGRLQVYDDGTIEFLNGPFKGYGGETLDGRVYIQAPGTQRQIQCTR